MICYTEGGAHIKLCCRSLSHIRPTVNMYSKYKIRVRAFSLCSHCETWYSGKPVQNNGKFESIGTGIDTLSLFQH